MITQLQLINVIILLVTLTGHRLKKKSKKQGRHQYNLWRPRNRLVKESHNHKDIQWWSNKWLMGTSKVYCHLNIYTNAWEVSLPGFSSERRLVTNVIERAIVTGRFLICLYSPQVRQTPTPQSKWHSITHVKSVNSFIIFALYDRNTSRFDRI